MLKQAHALPVAGRLASLLPGLVAALVVAGLGIADGGYFATAWGPATLVFLVAAALALLVQLTPNLGLRSLAIPALLGLLVLWILASSAWGSPSEAVPEAERTLVYFSAALALALVLRRGATTGLLVGLWAGSTAVCLYALATRLFPEQLAVFDPIAGYRLSEPIGYWNALGLLASLGTLLALGLVSRAEPLLIRLPAAASVVPLALTCYFTFSRGAWLALAAGLLVALMLDPRRLQLALTTVVVVPWAALAVLLASRSGPLTESGRHTLAAAAVDGRELVAVGVGLALFAAGAVAILAVLEPRVRVARVAHRVGSGALVAGVVALVIGAVLVLGGPAAIARSFAADPTADGAELNDRLFNLSGTGRVAQWRIALDAASEHSVVGFGAGSYQRYWLEHRAKPGSIRDAHSLYLETLGELGPIGLALVSALFAFPLVVAVRRRRRPLVPIATAALVAYLARAGIDWDWELPVLTLVALGCAGVIVAEGVERPRQSARRARIALLVAVVALMPVVAVTTLGNRAQAASADAFDDRDFDRAAREAETAVRLAPWSVEPLVLRGRAHAAAGDLGAARVTFRRAAAREPTHWRAWFELAAASNGAQRQAALGRARALNPLEGHIRDLEEGP
ncbi:hypothetical protein BH18ACT13_BH18ACT13_03320 [soil metagenome]